MATRVIHPPIGIGQRFGRLTILSAAEMGTRRDGRHFSRWLCQCDCGNEIIVRQLLLRNGETRSCGCFHKDIISTHGMSYTYIYSTWNGMINRCHNPNDTAYKSYGARGIYVYDEWRNNLEAFVYYIANNLGPRPPGYTLDRIDNEGPYTPGNIRWATRKQQVDNRRNSIYVEWKGKTIPLADAVRESGLPYIVVSNRLKYGWSLEQALTTPVRKR